jgi:hypothetical protein
MFLQKNSRACEASSGSARPLPSTISLPLAKTFTMISEQRPVVADAAEGMPMTQASSADPPAGHLQKLVPESAVQVPVGQDEGQPGKEGPSKLQYVVLVENAVAGHSNKAAIMLNAEVEHMVMRNALVSEKSG